MQHLLLRDPALDYYNFTTAQHVKPLYDDTMPDKNNELLAGGCVRLVCVRTCTFNYYENIYCIVHVGMNVE